jgi:hypothetical protein
MPIWTNLFGKIARAIREGVRGAGQRAEDAAGRIGELLMDEIPAHQPYGTPDSYDLTTTSSERQDHTPISEGWGSGPEVFREGLEEVFVRLNNESEHIEYFVWRHGDEARAYLGTEEHLIPPTGMAIDEYGHPLAFYWHRLGRPEKRFGFVDHPGMPELRGETFDFIEKAWFEIEEEAHQVVQDAMRGTFDRMRSAFHE